MSEKLEQVRPMLQQYVRRMMEKYPNEDPDDILSDGFEGFMVGYHRYNPKGKTRYTSWAHHWFYGMTDDRVEKERRWRSRFKNGAPADPPTRGNADERIVSIKSDLSDDGKTVIDFIFNPSPDAPPVQRKSAWESYICGRLRRSGWSRLRIGAAFKEVREVIA